MTIEPKDVADLIRRLRDKRIVIHDPNFKPIEAMPNESMTFIIGEQVNGKPIGELSHWHIYDANAGLGNWNSRPPVRVMKTRMIYAADPEAVEIADALEAQAKELERTEELLVVAGQRMQDADQFKREWKDRAEAAETRVAELAEALRDVANWKGVGVINGKVFGQTQAEIARAALAADAGKGGK